MTKKEKRERKEQDRGIVDFMMVSNHFFHSLKEWLMEMDDPRNQSYITYTKNITQRRLSTNSTSGVRYYYRTST